MDATPPKVQISSRENVRLELGTLNSIANDILSRRPDLEPLKQQMKSVNEVLWDTGKGGAEIF